jgi:nucleoside phosphorylase
MKTHPIGVLFAIRRESKPFIGRLRAMRKWPGRGRSRVLVVETGVGLKAARETVEHFVECHRPAFLIAAGYAGSLQPHVRVGDVIVANEVRTESATTWPVEAIAPRGLGETHIGRVLTANRLVGDAAEKIALGATHGALAVDMESAAIAEAAGRASIPFACVRVVSDNVESTLPATLVTLLAGNRIVPFALARALISRPSLAPHLWRLERDTRHAGKMLAAFLGRYIAYLPSAPIVNGHS